jgi:hypothetical protein
LNILKIATEMIVETLENFKYSKRHIPESQSYLYLVESGETKFGECLLPFGPESFVFPPAV